MFCCAGDKKQKKVAQHNQSKLNQQQLEQTLDINDEAINFNTTMHIQHIATMQTYKLTHDQQTIRSSRSNSRGTKLGEHLTQSILVLPYRRTPFIQFKKKGTDTTTRYLSTKQGYTLLVTGISN